MKSKLLQKWLKSEFNIDLTISFQTTKNDLVKSKNNITYNKQVRLNLGKKDFQGVYIWSRLDTDEIIYVGMSGKLIWMDHNKTKVVPNSYSVQKRLISSRGRYKLRGETVKREFTDVGKQFPQEARKAAKGERDEKIYGTATKKQIKELEKEGIDIFKVPEIKDN